MVCHSDWCIWGIRVTLQSHDLYDFLQSIHFLGPGSLLPVQSNIGQVLDAILYIGCKILWPSTQENLMANFQRSR